MPATPPPPPNPDYSPPRQVDLYYDFDHPVGGLPAAELVAQASWNVCPTATTFARDCYFEEDYTFEKQSGSVSVKIEDMPDGEWSLVVKRDLFNKITGAVRNVTALAQAALLQKVYIAYTAANVDLAWEMSRLNVRAAAAAATAGLGGEWVREGRGADRADCSCRPP